jgi:hypothetical protein
LAALIFSFTSTSSHEAIGMKKLINSIAGPIAAALLFVTSVLPSYAATTAFVSGAGNDANPCTLAQPCRSIGHALGFVAGNGGVISCLDAGPYTEGFSINLSYTVDCRGVVYTSTNFNGFAFSLSQTNNNSHQLVVFRNVIFDGAAGGGGAVQIGGGARVVFENCTFQNFTASPGFAVLFAPTAAGAHLTITDSVFANNGVTGSGGSIIIQPNGGGGTASVVIERTQVASSTYGIYASGTNGTVLVETASGPSLEVRLHLLLSTTAHRSETAAVVLMRKVPVPMCRSETRQWLGMRRA